jgi:hypothetical protein
VFAVREAMMQLPTHTATTLYDRLGQSQQQIEQFCQRWHIVELALFGSVLRDDFRPGSDIDVLVKFAPDFDRGLNETMQMREELVAMFGRSVDLIPKETIERSHNALRRKNILGTARILYVAGQ